ncbi:hypothetical protein [Fulvivirga ligni]|uniref:hypothetical protein n=1 Tax=Fulvivirga ligni TaxID=2904246 RepID=UPI001F39AEE4|nr:hypothetical protein [Fulvivirga ligni]UII23150.1 hypothetical protein LVD16_07915 [Fulvivirga ligni]
MAGRGKYQFLIDARKDLSGHEYLYIGPENEIKMNLVNRVTPDSAFEYSQKVFLAPRRYNARSFVIEGERLKVDRRDSIQVLDGHWMILYESDSIDASGLAILEYAHVEPEYVENLRSKMRELNLAKVSYHGAEVSFPFAKHPDFGSYDLISHPADKRGLIKVDSVTYLKRTPAERYRRYF